MAKLNEPKKKLAGLRQEIDQLDHQLVELLHQRMEAVAQVAGAKRILGISVRDPQRETALLEDRIRIGTEKGLSADSVDSIFRLILSASREYQANLHVDLPQTIDRRKVAVIGAKGGMGARMVELFASLGHELLEVDIGTDLTVEEAAQASDVVILSVPIDATEEMIRRVGPLMAEDGLLMDITSVKKWPVASMLDATKCSVVGTHPMFGPGVHTLQRQRVVVCPGRGEQWLAWVEAMFSAKGMVVARSTADAHDRAMSVVQVLNHFCTQVFGLALARSGIGLDETLEFTSPVYLLELYMVARHFAQSADLYAEIEMLNPRTDEVVGHFVQAAKDLAGVIQSEDRSAFRKIFQDVRQLFGSFAGEAMEQTKHLIDRLVERT